MKISFKHIKRFLNDNLDINSISESLFKLGHENEIENNLIDIEFTPNKGDCLSVLGITRDLNALHDCNNDIEIYEEEIDVLDFNFINNLPKFCPKICFLKIEIDDLSREYKPYLECYFKDLNLTKNNFFTDISNYLAYEIGQPTHCYDYNKVKDGISLSPLENNKDFLTLTGKEIKLLQGEYVFLKDEEIINLAGVMGGSSTKCSKSTKTAIVECAYFNPDMIMGKSIKYDLTSDASYKFERGVDILMHDFALRRFIKIVQDHASIKSLSIQTNDYHDYKNKIIDRDNNKINKILGTYLDNDSIDSILTRLGFLIDDNCIQVPSWRSDIESANDLAEEIARVIGYDNIDNSNLSIKNKKFTKNCHSDINNLRKLMKSHGFSEVINDPFQAESDNKSVVIVDNPLDSNRKYLRLNIIDSLVKNLDYNEKRQKESIKLFEISDIYKNDGSICSNRVLSIIVSGRQGNNYFNFNKKLDNNYLENLAYEIGLKNFTVEEINRDSFNSKLKNKIFYIETDITNFKFDNVKEEVKFDNSYDFNKYKLISEYPSSYRDISISLKEDEILEEIINLIFNIKINNLKDRFIFDFYHNKERNILKVGFRFIFQSLDKTLEEKEIDIEITKVFDALLKKDGVEIPGYKE